ncbi:MAG: hypothetical protein AVDCRST_MAG90-2906, partial [uncultured Microvirga sp.]
DLGNTALDRDLLRHGGDVLHCRRGRPRSLL